jgi:outer membrane protein assembly factor BamB
MKLKSFLCSLGALSLLCLFAGSAGSATGDWPQWRGPNRDGVSTETGLLRQWPLGGPPLVWKATGIGEGYATVSVAGNRLYTMGQDQAASSVHALNRADGKPVWSVKVGKSGAPGWGGFAGPRSTPTVDGDRLYALGHYGELVCLDTATGKEVWRRDFVKDFGGTMPEWAFSESPLIDGDRVVVTPGGSRGTLVALNKKTGELIWQTQGFTDNAQYPSVVVEEIAGVRQYIQMTDAHVVGVGTDGRMLWIADREGKTATIPTPIYYDNHVYVASGYGVGCNLFKLTKRSDKFTAEQVYAKNLMVNHHGGVVRVGDHLYGHCDNRGWVCQEFKTGESVWQEKGKQGKGSIVYADGHLYLRKEDGPGTMVLIEATPKGFVEKGRFDQPDRSKKNSWPHPVIAGGRLHLRDQDVLLCYDIKAK